MATRIIDKDRGFKKLVKNISKSQVVKVGLQGASGSKDRDGLTNVDLGMIHEFGLGNNPRRPFVRGYVDANKKSIAELRRKLALGVIDRRFDAKQAGTLLGESVEKGIKVFIAKGIPPDIKNASIAGRTSNRKSPHALIDTNQMRSAITHVVEIK